MPKFTTKTYEDVTKNKHTFNKNESKAIGVRKNQLQYNRDR